MLLSNKREPTTCTLSNNKLRPKEKRSSIDWHRRKLRDAPTWSTSRTLEIICKSRRWKKDIGRPKETPKIRRSDRDKSCKLPRTINSNWRPRDSQKNVEWKKSSRSRWLRSLLKMNVWSKWMLRREEWENSNTREKSKDFGKKNWRSTDNKENRNTRTDARPQNWKTSKNKLLLPRKKDCYGSTQRSSITSILRPLAHMVQVQVNFENNDKIIELL